MFYAARLLRPSSAGRPKAFRNSRLADSSRVRSARPLALAGGSELPGARRARHRGRARRRLVASSHPARRESSLMSSILYATDFSRVSGPAFAKASSWPSATVAHSSWFTSPGIRCCRLRRSATCRRRRTRTCAWTFGSTPKPLVREPTHGTAATGSSSLGLGLFIVREIVSRHGGDIRVTSSKELGTTFAVSAAAFVSSAPPPRRLDDVTRGRGLINRLPGAGSAAAGTARASARREPAGRCSRCEDRHGRRGGSRGCR